jgi:glycosyltransferase involved in cell wall biosynthesis
MTQVVESASARRPANRMRVMAIHNFYRHPGGEDNVFGREVALLRRHGHTVTEYVEDNRRIDKMSSAAVAVDTVWSRSTYAKLSKRLAEEKPDIVHCHNVFPLVSPSAYYACRDAGVAVVQAIHNPRLICPAATFYRDGHLCVECLSKATPWPAVVHGCYHGSRVHSAVVAGMITVHRRMNTWRSLVDVYLVATDFYKDLVSRAGLPAEKVAVKPHFVEAGPVRDPARRENSYALYVGRLDPEKGVRTLLAAWKDLTIPLKIRGDGPMAEEARHFVAAHRMNAVEFVDRLSEADLDRLMQDASFLVLPSEGYYETFGLVAIESYARGIPVLASRIGVMTEVVIDGVTGLHFNPGEAADLTTKAQWLWDHPCAARRLGLQARERYEQHYTPERNYDMLLSIYEKATGRPPAA